MQAPRIRGYVDQKAKGLDYSRLMIVGGDQPGQCDIRAVNYVVNAHLRRHDTYRSWFEYADDDQIVRRTMRDAADIEFVPVKHGQLTVEDLRGLAVNTPDPLQWGCFQFGVVQGADHFTFFASIDHVHVDAMIVGVTLMEFHMMYGSLVGGGAPLELPEAGSYDDFCIRQRQFTDALNAESPQIRAWTSVRREQRRQPARVRPAARRPVQAQPGRHRHHADAGPAADAAIHHPARRPALASLVACWPAAAWPNTN